MIKKHIIAVMLFSMLGIACGVGGDEEQSFNEGMQAICTSLNHDVSESAASDPTRLASAVSLWIADNLRNEEALKLWKGLAPLPPELKAAKLREQASRAGLAQCPVAHLFERR